MNCKQGDLAVIVHSVMGNEGKVVTCLRFLGTVQFVQCDDSIKSKPAWEIDRYLPTTLGVLSNVIADHRLRPLRPDDGTDETLLWAPVPIPATKPQTEAA